MQIKVLKTLNWDEKKQVQALISECQKFDGLHDMPYLENDFNYYPEMPTFILGWSDVEQRLIGFASLYASNKVDVNLTWLVTPKLRQQGYGRQLFLQAKAICHEYEFSEITIQIEGTQLAKQAIVLKKFAFEPIVELTEVLMQQTLPLTVKHTKISPLTVRLAQVSDLKALARVHMVGFNDDFNVVYRDLVTTLDNENLQLYVFYLQAKLVGSVTVEVMPTKQGYLFGYVIKKELQGQGYGQNALQVTLQQLQKQGITELKLAVEKENKLAQHVYQKCGFKAVTTIEYLFTEI